MKVVALLSWFDERTDWLAELVGSLAGVGVEHIVAVDGAYALYPQGRAQSGSEQANVVVSAAHGAGLGVTVHVPACPWPGEVEKRTALFALGHLVAEPGVDWLLVVDADELMDPVNLKAQVEGSTCDVAEVLLYERHDDHPDSRTMTRRLFRAHPGGIRVCGTHAHYVNGDGVQLWHGSSVTADQLWDVRIRHRAAERGRLRTERRLAYYERRNEYGIESVPA